MNLVIDAIAQAIESAVISGETLATLIASAKNFFSSLPAGHAEQLISSLPVERREALIKKFSS